MRAVPPRWVTCLLERVLPAGPAGQSILGDLREEWCARQEGAARDFWYATQAALLGVHYGAPRLAARARRVWGSVGLSAVEFAADVRLTLLRLARSPLQLALIVLALGLGVAAPAMMFTIVAGITRDLDLPDPDQLVHIGAPGTEEAVPAAWLHPLLDGVDGLEAVGLFASGDFDLSGAGAPPRRVRGSFVSDGVFEALGVPPAVGRALMRGDHEPSAAPAVVIAWDLWESHFGGDQALIGGTVRVNGIPATVVGVMPQGFHFRYGSEAWMPLALGDPVAPGPRVEAVGRLAQGATLEVVHGRVLALMESLRSTVDDVPVGQSLHAQPLRYRMIAREVRVMTSAMVVLISFVLLIACADVANLLVARALARSRDTAVRLALGGGRWRIVRQHLVEAIVIAVLGGALGFGLAAAGIDVFERSTRSFLAYWMVFRLDLSVLSFCAMLVLVAAAITGVLPAIQSRRVDVLPSLREGGRGSSAYRIGRVGRWLVAGEVMLSSALLVIAGLQARSALNNLRTEGRFETASILTARYQIPASDPDMQAVDFHREVMDGLATLRAGESAALASYLPGVRSGTTRTRVEVEGSAYSRPEDVPLAHMAHVAPGFFRTMAVELVAGRDLTWRDGREDGMAAVVNEAFARRWLRSGAIGARIRIVTDENAGPGADSTGWATVVGVAPALGMAAGPGDDGSGVYLPLSAGAPLAPALIVRAAPGVDPLSLLPGVQAALQRVDPERPLFEVGSLEEKISTSRAAEGVFAVLFVVFGAAGLVLAVVGLYGLLAFTVGQRTRELGVRLALGAPQWGVVWLALRGGALHLLGGVAAGCVLAAAAAPLMREALRGVNPLDPAVYVSVALLLMGAGVLAAYAPARRAISVDLVTSLRSE